METMHMQRNTVQQTQIGNLFIFVGPLMYNAWPIWVCWTVFLSVCIVSMSIMLGMVKWLERVTA